MRDEWEWKAEIFTAMAAETRTGTANTQLLATLDGLRWINGSGFAVIRYRLEVGPITRDSGGVR